MADDFKVRWEKAKVTFTETTLKKKPREKVGGIFKTSHTALSKTLEACDKAYEAIDVVANEIYHQRAVAKDLTKAVAKFEAALLTYQTASGKYTNVLRAEVNKEKWKDSEEKSIYERGLKFLDKELAALNAVITQKLAQQKQKLSTEIVALGQAERQILIWKENMEAAVKKGIAAAAKVKLIAAAAKTPAAVTEAIKAYNNAIPGAAGRDVCMQLVNARNVDGLRATPDKAYQLMVKWNTTNTEALADNATAVNILTKIKTFTDDVKYTYEWFGVALRT